MCIVCGFFHFQFMNNASDNRWLTILLDSMLTVRNTSETIATIKEKLCNEGMLVRLFNFSSPQATTEVQRQLCNLTNKEFTELYHDIVADIEWPKIFKKVGIPSMHDRLSLLTLSTLVEITGTYMR